MYIVFLLTLRTEARRRTTAQQKYRSSLRASNAQRWHSSVQFKIVYIYAPRKAHMRSTTSRLSEVSRHIATVPMFVRLTMTLVLSFQRRSWSSSSFYVSQMTQQSELSSCVSREVGLGSHCLCHSSPVCCHYRLFKKKFCIEEYLTYLPSTIRQRVLTFRLSNHRLPIQQRRSSNRRKGSA